MKLFRNMIPSTLFVFTLLLAGCNASDLVAEENEITAQSEANSQSCWGQATAVFAQFGEMGVHASGQEEPRVGLANLAKILFDQGVIEDDTMQALGAFVASAYGLEIDACM